VHKLHYQMKARPSNKLHNNFRHYSFAYRKDLRFPVLAYQTKWPSEWVKEWFYVKADTTKRVEFKAIVMGPIKASSSLKRSLCNISGATQTTNVAFHSVVDKIGTWNLVQEFLANRVFPYTNRLRDSEA
jgi:hypothetical protein